jgi:hypothetical protein
MVGGGGGKEMQGSGFNGKDMWAEGSHMSMDSDDNYNISNYAGGSVTMMSVGGDSSVGSNESRKVIFKHPGLRDAPTANYSVGNRVFRPNRVAAHTLNEDALARVLMDPNHPTEILSKYQLFSVKLKLRVFLYTLYPV